MNNEIREALDGFADDNNVKTKGSLSVVVQLTRAFMADSMPISAEDYKTSREGQVKGLGGQNLKSILAEHGITRTLSREGGRTSRGSMGLMGAYVDLVNRLSSMPGFDLGEIEDYWTEKVRVFFASKPFSLGSDSSISLGSSVDSLISQARRREKDNPGTTYTGTLLQDLVAAKLTLIMPEVRINGADVADAPTGRGGDFMLGDTAIHCTTMPGQPLLEKCRANVSAGTHPVIITIRERVQTARDLAEDNGLADRVEVWDVQQFLSTNIYEHGVFRSDERHETMSKIVSAYNRIIDEYENDPSLKISYE
jgi:hypothetical protein